MSETNLLSLRGRVASLSRSRTPDDPELLAARRELAADGIAAYVERAVAKAPPLTNEQRERIAALIAPGVVMHGASA